MSAVGRKFSDDPLFADPIPDCPALTAGETVNGWRVVEPVGNGGFGKVFRAVKKGVVGALKIYSVAPGSSARDEQWRFEQEIEILNAAKGVFAPRLYGEGRYSGVRYFVMEYLEPVKPSTMPHTDAGIARMMLDLTDAIQTLHELDWVHCDIKPHNIARRRNGKYVLIDFGSAHRMDPDGVGEHQFDECSNNYHSGRYMVAGTKYYEPPELYFRPCRDVYALGHILRDCFKETVPFEWSVIINKCISWQPKHRYPDVDALRHDIADLDRIKEETYWTLRKKKIMEHRAEERSLLGAVTHTREVDWDEILSLDTERSSPSMPVFRINLNRYPVAHFMVKEPIILKENTIVLVEGPGILNADIRGPSSSIVVLRRYVSLNNISTECPPDNELLYAIVGPGSYLNFPNIQEKDRPKFFSGKSKRRIFRDMDATTAFRFGGPDVFSEVEQQTLAGLKSSDIPPRYRDKLLAFFKGEAFSVIPDKI